MKSVQAHLLLNIGFTVCLSLPPSFAAALVIILNCRLTFSMQYKNSQPLTKYITNFTASTPLLCIPLFSAFPFSVLPFYLFFLSLSPPALLDSLINCTTNCRKATKMQPHKSMQWNISNAATNAESKKELPERDRERERGNCRERERRVSRGRKSECSNRNWCGSIHS